MKESLLRAFSQSSKLNLLPSLCSKLRPYSILPPTLSSSSSRFFSSKNPASSESNFGHSQKQDEEISDEELRKMANKLTQAGDGEAFEEAFPTVFEGMMKKILAGKSHDEIEKEMFGKREDDEDSDTS